MTQSVLEEILKAGIQAPSADNLQPWRFVIQTQPQTQLGKNLDRVDLYLAQDRTHDFAASGLLTLYVSAGAVIENIRVAAFRFGLKLQVQYFPSNSDPLWVASLSFAEMAPKKHTHEEVLFQRLTNRKFYSSKQVDPKIYGNLSHFASEEGFRLSRIKRGEPKYKELEQVLAQADELRYEVERLHRELFKTVRFDGDAEKTRDGLPIPTFEAGPGSGLLFKMMASWNRMKFLNALGLSKVMGHYTKLQMRSSEAALLLTAPSQRPLDYARGGEVMERLWHEATLNGLAMQPMEALPIFILNMQLKMTDDFSETQKGVLEKLMRELYELFGVHDTQGLIMLWRIGYAKPVTARSPRRPVESFIKES